MSKKVHQPPSRARYQAKNPAIAGRVPKAVRDAFEELKKTTGVSLSILVKDYVAASLAKPLEKIKKEGEEKEMSTETRSNMCPIPSCGVFMPRRRLIEHIKEKHRQYPFRVEMKLVNGKQRHILTCNDCGFQREQVISMLNHLHVTHGYGEFVKARENKVGRRYEDALKPLPAVVTAPAAPADPKFGGVGVIDYLMGNIAKQNNTIEKLQGDLVACQQLLEESQAELTSLRGNPMSTLSPEYLKEIQRAQRLTS